MKGRLLSALCGEDLSRRGCLLTVVDIAGLGIGMGLIGNESIEIDNFMDDGASFPWSSPDYAPPHIYAASTNRTWLFWDGYQPVSGINKRVIECAVKDHTTGNWVGNYLAGIRSLADQSDLHGIPTVCRDSSGYVYVFYATHGGTTCQWSSTVSPDDPTRWRTGVLSVTATFMQPYAVGASLYLFYSTTGAGIGNQEAIAVTVATTLSGAPTFGSQKTLFDSAGGGGGNGWLVLGSGAVNGTDIILTFTWAAASQTPPLKNVYYAVYDTITGNVRNFDSSLTVVPGSQPISLATMDASFKVFSATTAGSEPSFALDAGGASHIVVGNSDNAGVPSANLQLLHTMNSGAGWSATHTIYAYSTSVDATGVGSAVVPNQSGGVDVYFSDGAADPPSNHGNIRVATRSSGGVWTGPTLVQAFGAFGLTSVTPIHASPGTGAPNAVARVAWAEVTPNGQTISGALKGYAYGDSGLLRRPRGFGLIVAPGTSTLDPTTKSSKLTLSNGNLTATCNQTQAGAIARGTVSRASGRYFWSGIPTIITTANTVNFGICNPSQVIDTSVLGATANGLAWRTDGSVRINGSVVGNWSTFAQGDTLDLAIDIDILRIWGRVNGGNWNASGTANPVTGVGGVNIVAIAGPYMPAVEPNTITESATLNLGGAAYP